MSSVSVIIPCYNAALWIRETLNSVQAQRLSAMEVIVVDDGSTDRSAEIVAEEFPSVSLVRTTNGGPSRARNIGWKRARGAWIQFLDSDDLLHPEKLEIQFAAALLVPPSVGVIYSTWQRFGLVNGKWQLIGSPETPEINVAPVLDLLTSDNFAQVGSLLIRRDLLETIGGFDERHWLIEDVDLLLRIAIAGGRFFYVQSDGPLFFYRERDALSLSRLDHRRFVEGCLRNIRLVDAYLLNYDLLSTERSRILANHYSQVARYFAAVDGEIFESLMRRIDALSPNFLPTHPWKLRILSRLIGYRRAEKVAVLYRSFKPR